jgi:Bacterial archaeo-eukaryotic release factor family 2
MADLPIALPLLKLGRLELDAGLRAIEPELSGSDLVVTATAEVPESESERQHAWDVGWADAARTAFEQGAAQSTAQALAVGAGNPLGRGVRVVVAAQGQAVLARWLPPGFAVASVQVGPLPRLLEVAAAAARRPAHVVVLADRDGASVIAHAAGDQGPGRLLAADDRPGAERDPHPGRPPALHHGERHQTGPEPESGGERNAKFIAARAADAAASVGAHVILGAGDQHILDAVASHLPDSLGPVVTIDSGPVATDSDEQLGARIDVALDGITAAAISAVGDLVASAAEGPGPAAVRGIDAVAGQLAEQQVAVLLVAADIGQEDDGGSYWIGQRPTEFLTGDSDSGVKVSLADGLVWAALHQDAIVVRLPDRSGPLAGEPVAALLRRGRA